MHVTAIDNGPLREHVLESGLVQHLRADGLKLNPPRPLDWMVCDMVEQPIRVAGAHGGGFREGWCRHDSTSLPMKKRWQEIAAAPLTASLPDAGRPLRCARAPAVPTTARRSPSSPRPTCCATDRYAAGVVA